MSRWGFRYTLIEDQLMVQMVLDGKTLDEIAKALDRPSKKCIGDRLSFLRRHGKLSAYAVPIDRWARRTRSRITLEQRRERARDRMQRLRAERKANEVRHI